jgi:hypothetical protein
LPATLVSVLSAGQAATTCAIFNQTADGWSKEEAASAARAALRETIVSWKEKNAITGVVRELPEKPQPRLILANRGFTGAVAHA